MRSGHTSGKRRVETVVLLSAALSLEACVGTPRATPLYAGPRQSADKVSRLSGPITHVDGHPVDGGGGSFELLPGCHVVQIGGRIGDLSPTPVSGWSATLPPLVYAFRMRPGSTYSISFEPEPELGRRSVGFGRIVAREHDDQGKRRVVPRVRDRDDVLACFQGAGPGTLSPSP